MLFAVGTFDFALLTEYCKLQKYAVKCFIQELSCHRFLLCQEPLPAIKFVSDACDAFDRHNFSVNFLMDRKWSKLEDSMLLLCVRIYGSKWSRIAQVYNFTGSPYLYRSDDALRNRYLKIYLRSINHILSYEDCVVIFDRMLSADRTRLTSC